MDHSSKILTNLTDRFSDVFQDAVSAPESYVRDPSRDFSRASVLTLESTAKLVYQLCGQSSNEVMINAVFNDGFSCNFSPSALTQARSKIHSDLFKTVFFKTLPVFHRASDLKLINGYEIAAADGSELAVVRTEIPDSLDCDPFRAKTKNGHERDFVHINALFNVSSQTFMDFIFQPGSVKNEDKALMELIENPAFKDRKIIITADRGYESLISFYRLQQKGIKYVIRIKDINSKTSIARNYNLPQEDQFDVPYSVLLSKNSGWKEHDGKPVKYLLNYKNIPEFENQNYLALDARIVRLPIVKADGSTLWETLMTNLDQDEFSIDDLREIYHMRWEIETGFRDLKCTLGLGKLHSRKPDLIVQEIYAAATVYNFASSARRILERFRPKQKSHKYEYRISFTFVCQIVMEVLFNAGNQIRNLWEICSRRTIPIRPGRPNTR